MAKDFKMPNAHAIEIADFLTKAAGKSLLSALYARRPDIQADAYKSGVAAGWELAVDEIAVIAIERPLEPDPTAPKFINPADDMDPKHRPNTKV